MHPAAPKKRKLQQVIILWTTSMGRTEGEQTNGDVFCATPTMLLCARCAARLDTCPLCRAPSNTKPVQPSPQSVQWNARATRDGLAMALDDLEETILRGRGRVCPGGGSPHSLSPSEVRSNLPPSGRPPLCHREKVLWPPAGRRRRRPSINLFMFGPCSSCSVVGHRKVNWGILRLPGILGIFADFSRNFYLTIIDA